jgi:urea transport system ATP-binding protein
MICSKTKPTTGRVLFNGLDLTRMSEHQICELVLDTNFRHSLFMKTSQCLSEISLPKMHGLFQSLTFAVHPSCASALETMAGDVFARSAGQTLGDSVMGKSNGWEIGMLLMQGTNCCCWTNR